MGRNRYNALPNHLCHPHLRKLTIVLPTGSPPQKGIVHYGLAQNRQNPLAGAASAAVFNTWRRTRNQILYWSVPMLIAYETMQWAIER